MYSSNSSTSSSAIFFFLLLFFLITGFVAVSPDDHNSHRLNEEYDKNYLSKDKDRRQQRIEEKEKLVLKKLLSKPRRKIDELCSELDRICFTITDEVLYYGNTLIANRDLFGNMMRGFLLSRTRLQIQQPLNWENFNSKMWSIRKDYVPLTYTRLMIAGAFLSGTLELNTKRKQDVLIIGLGGGYQQLFLTDGKSSGKTSFDQFLGQVRIQLNVTVVDIDPVMKKVATKWFGFAESPLHRIVLDDGVKNIRDAVKRAEKYDVKNKNIRDAVKRAEKYDVIIIDVSYNIPVPMIAPIKEFLEDDLIASMKAITTGNGAVIVNISTSRGHSHEAGKALSSYCRHFPSCYFMNHLKNKMLFCSAKENNPYLNNADKGFRDSFMTVDNALRFRLFSKVYPSID